MKLVIGLPWYSGPDENTFPLYFDQMMYYGALRERSIWRDVLGKATFKEALPKLPPLNEMSDDSRGDPTEADWDRLGRLEIAVCNYSRTSLVGLARELVVDAALEWGGDYLFWWDADMRFDHSAMLELWRRDKPAVGGLAFTARDPVHPVIFTMVKSWDKSSRMEKVEGSSIIFDYPKDSLIGNKEVGGELAFGAGVVLYNLNVFREIPKPWFASTGCGEDFFFCHRCSEFGVPRFVDTAVKTQHKAHAPTWIDEDSYWASREGSRDSYVGQFGESVNKIKNGKVVLTNLTGEQVPV